jgi:hypothetical protein
MGHTRCHKPLFLTKYIKHTTAHQNPWLSTCSMRPCAHTRPTPPRQILAHTYAAALSIWRREEAGIGHTWCHKPPTHTKQIKHTTAHQKQGWHLTAYAPVLAHTPLSLDKCKQIYTLLCCRWRDGRERAWVTHVATRHSTSQNK